MENDEQQMHDLLEYGMEAIDLFTNYASTSHDLVELDQQRSELAAIIVQVFASYQSYIATVAPSAHLAEHYHELGRLFSFLCVTIGLGDDDNDYDEDSMEGYDAAAFGEDVSVGCTAQEVSACCKQTQFKVARTILGQTSCLICLEDYCEKKPLFRLYCRHIFHGECLSTWLEKKKTCPLCKTCVLDKPLQGPPTPHTTAPPRRSKRLRGETPTH